VPVDFNANDPSTDPAIVERVTHLSYELQNSPQREASASVAKKLEVEVSQQVQYFLDLEGKYSEAQRLIAKLEKECALLNASREDGRV
jgi:hypothetical protein